MRCIAWALVAFLACGCGVSRPKIGEPLAIGGTAKFSDGTPLSQVQLYFVPTDAPAPAFGKVADDGSFTLVTYENKPGICVGKYVVYIRPLPTATAAESAKGAATLRKAPEKFKDDASKSPLEVEVTGSSAKLDLNVSLK